MTLPNKQYRWITLDAVGTLIDPHPSVGHLYSAVLARHGVEAAHSQLQTRFIEVFKGMTRSPREGICDASEYQFWKKLVLDVISPWMNNGKADAVFEDAYESFARADSWRAIDGAHELLDVLSERGYKLALLSNADSRIRKIIQELGLATHMEHIFLSCDLGYEKPDSRIFKKVEGILGCGPEEILHVGDSRRNDGEGPRSAGWQTMVIGAELPDLASLAKAVP